jgi:hypothetical protein
MAVAAALELLIRVAFSEPSRNTVFWLEFASMHSMLGACPVHRPPGHRLRPGRPDSGLTAKHREDAVCRRPVGWRHTAAAVGPRYLVKFSNT